MPSRNNPNLPTRIKQRLRTRARPHKPRSTVTVTSTHRKTGSRKQARKSARNAGYALGRAEVQKGEVEMKDGGMSRRQIKLALRSKAVEEANAKKGDEMRVDEKEVGKEERSMDID